MERRTRAFILTHILTSMGGVAAILGTIVTVAFSYCQCTRDYSDEVSFAPSLFKNLVDEGRERQLATKRVRGKRLDHRR